MKIISENGKYACIPDKGKVISYGDSYCDKLYRKANDFSDCTEIDKPIENEEPTEADYSEVGKILMGVSE